MTLVRVERADGVARVVLCRSGMHNALVPEPLDELAQLRGDPDSKA
jgi:enoyl-CoA hydratase/carnithine racemase